MAPYAKKEQDITQRVWDCLVVLFSILLVLLVFGGGAYAFFTDWYFENRYLPEITDAGYQLDPDLREFGRTVNGKREGWWIKSYAPYIARGATTRKLAGRYIMQGKAAVRATPRPESIGQYRDGLKEGMWLYWVRPPWVENGTDPRDFKRCCLDIDLERTGYYERGIKVGAFNPDEFHPLSADWRWPPLRQILDAPWYVDSSMTSSDWYAPLKAHWPDDIEKAPDTDDPWDSNYDATPWRCLTVSSRGEIQVPFPWDCPATGRDSRN